MLSRILWAISSSSLLCLSMLFLSTNMVNAGPTPPTPGTGDSSVPADLTGESSTLRDRSLTGESADIPSTQNPALHHLRRDIDSHSSSSSSSNSTPLTSPSNTITTPASNMERHHINPNLDIIISPGFPLPPTISNNTLHTLLTHALTSAQISAVRFGPNTSLPGGLHAITDGGLRYEVVAPWLHQSQKFTWAQYVELTRWIYWFELGGDGEQRRGRGVFCSFLLFEMGGPWGQTQIARGEVRLAEGGGGVTAGSGNGSESGTVGQDENTSVTSVMETS